MGFGKALLVGSGAVAGGLLLANVGRGPETPAMEIPTPERQALSSVTDPVTDFTSGAVDFVLGSEREPVTAFAEGVIVSVASTPRGPKAQFHSHYPQGVGQPLTVQLENGQVLGPKNTTVQSWEWSRDTNSTKLNMTLWVEHIDATGKRFSIPLAAYLPTAEADQGEFKVTFTGKTLPENDNFSYDSDFPETELTPANNPLAQR